MKLAPVLTELVKPIPGVEVVQRGITVEDIAVAVPRGDQALLGRLTVAQAELEADGTLQGLRRGNGSATRTRTRISRRCDGAVHLDGSLVRFGRCRCRSAAARWTRGWR